MQVWSCIKSVGDGELLLTIMSSLAQEESRSISENVRWGQRKKFSDGRYSLNYTHFLGYDKGEDGSLVINDEQAKIVRRIFGEFLAGYTPFQIAKRLTEEGVPTPAGKKKWSYTTVRRVLSNETYMGDKLLQKTYSIDFLSKDRLKNHGQIPQFYVEQDHPAIIPPETFRRVQDELERRKGCHPTGGSIFSGKIYCGECGQIYGSKVWHSNDPYRKVVWQCNDKFKTVPAACAPSGETPVHEGEPDASSSASAKGSRVEQRSVECSGSEGAKKQKCSTPTLSEDQIKAAFERVLVKLDSDKDEIIDNLRTVLTCSGDDSMERLEKQKEKLERERYTLSDLYENEIKKNARIAQNQDEYRKRENELRQESERLDAEIKALDRELAEIERRKRRIEDFICALETAGDEFTEDAWCVMVERVTVYKEKIVFTLTSGAEVEA